MEVFNFTIKSFGSDEAVKNINAVFDAMSKLIAKEREYENQLKTLRDRKVGNKQTRSDLITELTGDPNKAKEAFSKIKTELRTTKKEIEDLAKVAAKSKILPEPNRITRHTQEIRRLTNEYAKLSEVQRRGQAGKNLLAQIKTEATQLRQIRQEIAKATGAGQGGGSSAFGGFANTLSSVFKFQLATAIIQKFSESILYAEETVRKFDAEITNLSALLGGKAAESIGKLESEALRLGRTTAFTALEVVELQQVLTKLGFNPTSVINMSAAVIDFSVAVRESADRVAQLTGATLKAFNLTALDTTRVVDVLTRSTITTATNFGYLETALPTVSAAAEEAGVSFQDLVGDMEGVEGANTALETTVAVLGVLADRGVKASTAATSFRNILIESAKRGLNFREALDRVNESTNKLATAFSLFGKRGAVQALILAANLEELNAKTKELITGVDSFGKALASARSVAEVQLTSIQGQVTLLKSAWDGFILSIANTEAYKNTTKAFLSAVTQMLNGISALIDGTVSLQEAFSNVKFKESFLENPISYLNPLTVIQKTYGEIAKSSASIAKERNLIEQVTVERLQEQARQKVGIYSKEISAIGKLKRQRELELEVEERLVETGLERLKAKEKAKTLIAEQIKLLDELVASEKKAEKERESVIDNLLNNTKSTLSVESRESGLRGYLDILQDTLKFQDRNDVAQVNKIKSAIAAVEARMLALGITSEKAGKAGKGALESMQEALSKLQKQLKEATTDEQRFSILEKIEVLQGKIKKQEDAYENFIRNINAKTVKLLPKQQKDAYIQGVTDRLSAEQRLEERRARARITSEEALTKELDRINTDYEIKRLMSIIEITETTDREFSKLIKDLEAKTAKAAKLTLEVNLTSQSSLIDLRTAEAKLQIQKQITEETLRSNLLSIEDLKNERDKNLLKIRDLELRRDIAKISKNISGFAKELTDEEKTQLATLKAKNEELRLELNLRQSREFLSTDLNIGKFNREESLKQIDAYNKFLEGKLPDIVTLDLFGGELYRKTSMEQLQEILNEIQNEYDVRRAEEEVKNAASLLGLDFTNVEYWNNYLEKQKAFLEVRAKQTDDANTKELKEQEKISRQKIREQERYYRQLSRVYEQLGEGLGQAIGAALDGDAEAIKASLKKILTSLIDMVVQSKITIQNAIIAAAIPEVVAGNPAALAKIKAALGAIVKIKAIGEVGKAIVSRFEYGGEVKGKPHSQGGVKYHVKGTNYYPELEGGEFIVNKKATAKHLPLLKQLNGATNHYGAVSRKMFGTGGIIPTPQVINPTLNNNITTTLDPVQTQQQANAIAQAIVNALTFTTKEQNKELVGAVVNGLNVKTQQDILRELAVKNSRI